MSSDWSQHLPQQCQEEIKIINGILEDYKYMSVLPLCTVLTEILFRKLIHVFTNELEEAFAA